MPKSSLPGSFIKERFEAAECRYSPDVIQRVTDSPFLWPALMLVEIRLKLLFGFVSVRYKFRSCAEC